LKSHIIPAIDAAWTDINCGNHGVGATNSPRFNKQMYWANLSPLQMILFSLALNLMAARIGVVFRTNNIVFDDHEKYLIA